MKHVLKEHERTKLDSLVAKAEKQTGAQIVLACVARSDVYAELPWKAFALGAAVGGALCLLELLRPAWPAFPAMLAGVLVALGSGALAACAVVVFPKFARLFLDPFRAEIEVRQYAESLFLSRGLFDTRHRTGILLLASLFEQKAFLHADIGLTKRLSDDARKKIIASVEVVLAQGRAGQALADGLAGLEAALGPGPSNALAQDELPNAVIEGEGA